MGLIYIPTGKAREYTPLGLNLFSGCDHGCTYCYNIRGRGKFDNHNVVPKPGVLARLEKECSKYRGKQIFMSFTCDPYCRAEKELEITRQALEILLKNRVPVMILTKGGTRVLRDINLFKEFGENIVVGQTLTQAVGEIQREPKAETNVLRAAALNELHKQGIKTWVSAEPVYTIEALLRMIEFTQGFVDHYKIGKLNYGRTNINWKSHGAALLDLLEKHDISAYIKDDTAKSMQHVPEKYRKRDGFLLQGWKGEETTEQTKLFE